MMQRLRTRVLMVGGGAVGTTLALVDPVRDVAAVRRSVSA